MISFSHLIVIVKNNLLILLDLRGRSRLYLWESRYVSKI
ncbi:unnamed protein product [Arabidopsis halleri]